MSLAANVGDFATAAGAAIKDVSERVDTLEGYAPVIVLTAAAYAALSGGPVAGVVYVVQG